MLGFAAGLLTVAGLFWLAIQMARGKAHSSRATWFIWTTNSLMLARSNSELGADATEWLAWAYLVGCVVNTALAIKFGRGGWSRSDKICLGLAALTVVAWALIGPAVTMVGTLVIDLFGVIPTIRDTRKEPGDEDRLAWTLMAIGGILGVLAVERWVGDVDTILVALYPVQIAVTACWIVYNLRRFR